MDALTKPTHRDALRIIAQAGDRGVTAQFLAAQLGATRAWALRVLTSLEEQGFVAGTPDMASRKGGTATVFTINAAAVETALDELRTWVLGGDVPVACLADSDT